MKRIILNIMFVFILSSVLNAGTTGTFLGLPVSAKEVSIGNAFVAVNREIDAVTYNPAGLSKFDGFGISVLYNKLLFGNNYGKINIVHPAGFGLIGISFAFLNIPIDRAFESGSQTGSKSLTDINLGVGFQRDITESISIGVTGKFISMDLGEVKGSTAGADAGILYQINPKAKRGRFNIGLCVRNIGLGIKFEKEREKLPMVIAGGIMYQPMRMVGIYGEVDNVQGIGIEYGGGIEIGLMEIIKLRAGYRGIKGGGIITGGMSIGGELGSTMLGIEYGMLMGAEMSHIVEMKIKRPAIFEIGGAEKIPYDGVHLSRIAVSDFEVEGCEESIGRTVSEWLRSDWGKSKALTVLARENMEEILKEQEIQMSGITSEKDAVMVGEILNVRYMIFGKVSKVGSEYYINVKVVDVGSGKVEATGEEVAGSRGGLRLAVCRLALKIDPGYEK